MIREIGTVTAVADNWVTVTTQLQQGCGSCQQQNHCGAGILSKALPNRRGTLEVYMANPPLVGSNVEVLMPEQAMLKFSLLLYLLPILALFAGAMLGQMWQPAQEGVAILLAVSAFACSFWGLKRWLQRRDVQVRALMQVNILPLNQP